MNLRFKAGTLEHCPFRLFPESHPLSNKFLSIHDLPPIEIGGTIARRGFAVQDHVAASHCLDMIENAALTQVWCETQDDVTLLWRDNSGDVVEFVQVKANEFDQLWSIAKLLEKEKHDVSDDFTEEDSDVSQIIDGKNTIVDKTKRKKKNGHCILEKSLQYDRCKETVRFQIVTTRPVKEELSHLSEPLDSKNRDKTNPKYLNLIEKLKERLADFKSANGNDYTFWVDRVFWRCVHSLDSLRQANLWRLSGMVQNLGQFLATDQIEELYNRLLIKVYDGGIAQWGTESGKKKILRDDLRAWFSEAVQNAVHPGQHGTGKRLEEKLRDAGIAHDQFEAISEMRHRYRLERLTPKYASQNGSNLESQIRAKLMTLRANLDGRLLEVDGVTFHAMCINEINDVCKTINESETPVTENLYGCMYDLADRCIHRFVRARP